MPDVSQKPIQDVKQQIDFIRRDINKLKTDVICIKADLSIIKDFIKQKEAEKNKGWFW
jgi:hypothetical protein